MSVCSVALHGDGTAIAWIDDGTLHVEFDTGAAWRADLAAGRHRSSQLAFGRDRLVAVWRGCFSVFGLDGTLRSTFRKARDATVVRRGVVADGIWIEERGLMRVSDRGRKRQTLGVDVPFIGSLNTLAIDPAAQWLEVAGACGMDAGWSSRFDLRTGACLSEGGSGYGIDAIDIDANGRTVFIDDYMGLAGVPGFEIDGRDVWLAGDVVVVLRSDSVLRIQGGAAASVDLHWPSSLSVSDDGNRIAVVS